MATKRPIESFFLQPAAKKARVSSDEDTPVKQTSAHSNQGPSSLTASSLLEPPSPLPPSTHPSYPFPIPQLPDALSEQLFGTVPGQEGHDINDAPDLDLVYFQPFIPRPAAASALFTFLRASLPFYRVKYAIKRGGHETQVNTPRFTTVFGVDATSTFSASATGGDGAAAAAAAGPQRLLDSTSGKAVNVGRGAGARYGCAPRPVPDCLDALRRLAEAFTGADFNFVLVNYYADGRDSISYHSDDERFLGSDPAIASLSLGATRDFLLRHKPLASQAPAADASRGIYGNRGTVAQVQRKPPTAGQGGGSGGVEGDHDAAALTEEEERRVHEAHKNPLKLPLASGDMVLMRGRTQRHWLHSIPKRSVGKNAASSIDGGGRINITFRKALVRGGTENYYQYNVGQGPPMKWDDRLKTMVEWKGGG